VPQCVDDVAYRVECEHRQHAPGWVEAVVVLLNWLLTFGVFGVHTVALYN